MSRGTLDTDKWYSCFVYRIVTFYDRSFQISSTTLSLLISQSTTPIFQRNIGLGCSPFARRYLGNRFFFLFLRVLRCFSSPGMPSVTYEFSNRYMQFMHVGFPIRKFPDRSLLAAPRDISVLIPSFFGS